MESDIATNAVIGLLGVQAITGMVQAIWGGGGSKGLVERVAVVEAEVKHVRRDLVDVKRFFGVANRNEESD